MKRCVIIGGAPINNYEYIKKNLRSDDFFIFCDSGLKHLQKLNVKPSVIVGDFDSFENPNMDVLTITLPKEKDDTDTMYGVKYALEQGFNDFLLLGVVGSRLDHTLGNITILWYLERKGATALIIDDYSEIEIIKNTTKYITNKFKYFSLLNLGGSVSQVSIENAKYDLNKAQITNYYPIGVSNEVINDRFAKVEVFEGTLLLIKIFSE